MHNATLCGMGSRHVHGSEMTQTWDPYSGNGSGDTALINAAMYGA